MRQAHPIEQGISTIERAYQLARCSSTVADVRSALKREGYSQVEAHLSGRKIRADLERLLLR